MADRVWRVQPRVDNLGNQLWSLQYDHVWSGPGESTTTYGLWKEYRVFRDEARALEALREIEDGDDPPRGLL